MLYCTLVTWKYPILGSGPADPGSHLHTATDHTTELLQRNPTRQPTKAELM